MRGRLASGILTRLGLSELVARTDQEYIDLAVKLGQDANFRDRIRKRIETSRHLVFEDLAPVRALETFLLGVASESDFRCMPKSAGNIAAVSTTRPRIPARRKMAG